MCGRYTLYTKSETIAKRYDIKDVPENIRQNFNVAPGQIMPVVTEDEDGQKSIQLMKWGLVPFWAKDPKIGYRLINARDDTIFEKPVWRNVILKRRCLIPSDGFYEWKKLDTPKPTKVPFYIHPKEDGVFSFAGVWDSWKDVEGKQWQTYSIITTDTNKEMASIHNRMPVILDRSQELKWLSPKMNKRQDIEPFLHPYHDNGLEIYKVSHDVNNAQNNDEHLIYKLD